MPVSIREVAARAGVSPSTVSQVLNSNYGVKISAATRDRVKQVADELGYSPNQFARSLGRRKTDTIGLMVSGIRNPFFAELVETAESLLMAAGYQVFLDCGPSQAGSYGEHVKLRGWPVDGVLIWAFPDQNLEMFLGRQAVGLPVVYLGYPRTDGACTVYFDLYTGITEALRHLHAQGYRKIGYVFPDDGLPSRVSDKLMAYRDFCGEAGWPERIIVQERREQTRRAGLETALMVAAMPEADRPDAVICHNDSLAQGFYFGARRAGLAVPGDIAVVGCDGNTDSEYLDLPLTSVLLPIETLCLDAIKVLQAQICPERTLDLASKAITPKLRIGGTT